MVRITAWRLKVFLAWGSLPFAASFQIAITSAGVGETDMGFCTSASASASACVEFVGLSWTMFDAGGPLAHFLDLCSRFASRKYARRASSSRRLR